MPDVDLGRRYRRRRALLVAPLLLQFGATAALALSGGNSAIPAAITFTCLSAFAIVSDHA